MWAKIRGFFLDSETIAWGRLQMLAGILMATDLAPIMPDGWVPYYVIIAGVLTEFFRRLRDPDLGA